MGFTFSFDHFAVSASSALGAMKLCSVCELCTGFIIRFLKFQAQRIMVAQYRDAAVVVWLTLWLLVADCL